MKMSEHGRERLRRRALDWATRLNVEPRVVRVQRMTRKWGSCSTSGTITLADDLAEAESDFQDFVIAHELLHLRLPNHGRLFKALMTIHVPDWRRHDLDRKANRYPSPDSRKTHARTDRAADVGRVST